MLAASVGDGLEGHHLPFLVYCDTFPFDYGIFAVQATFQGFCDIREVARKVLQPSGVQLHAVRTYVGLHPYAVVLVLHGALPSHLLQNVRQRRQSFRQHHPYGIPQLHPYLGYAGHSVAGQSGTHQPEVAGHIVGTLYLGPCILICEGESQSVQYCHGCDPRSHSSGDDPAQIACFDGVGIVEHVGQILHLPALGVPALGLRYGGKAADDPAQRKCLGEKSHLLLVGYKLLGHSAGVTELYHHLAYAALSLPNGESYGLGNQTVCHAQLDTCEIGGYLPLGQVYDGLDVLRFQGLEELCEYGGHLQPAGCRFQLIKDLGDG